MTGASTDPSGSGIVTELARRSRLVVALSGGVDSTVVADLALRALGPDRVLAVTLVGPATAEDERRAAEEAARQLRLRHRLVRVDPLGVEGYRENPSNRCFFCRTVEASALLRVASQEGGGVIVDGVHLDDEHDDRPGLRAMNAAGVEHPLIWGGWRKADVRAYARAHRLANAERPSEACLASRISHGLAISAGVLRRVEAAEAAIRALGFRRVRVRVDRLTSARVEVDPDEVDRLLARRTAASVQRALGALGFEEVALDPRGYRVRASG